MSSLRTCTQWMWRGAVWLTLGVWLCSFLIITAAWIYSLCSGVSVERKHEYRLASREGANYAEVACADGRFRFYWSWTQERYEGLEAGLRLLQEFSQSTRWAYYFNKADPLTLPDPTANYQKSFWRKLGFGWHHDPAGPYGWEHHGILMPGYALIAMLAIPWLLIVRLTLRRRTIRQRREGGLCVRCGYDLRASGERCPECGLGINVR